MENPKRRSVVALLRIEQKRTMQLKKSEEEEKRMDGL